MAGLLSTAALDPTQSSVNQNFSGSNGPGNTAGASGSSPQINTPQITGGTGIVGPSPTLVGVTPIQPPTALTTGVSTTTGTIGNFGTAAASGVNLGNTGPGMTTNAATNLNDITSSNSPYMQLARQQGYLSAAGRGLGNSTLGAGASEAAAVQAAAPLAEQNAQIASGAALQNAQLQTQASEFNTSQAAAAQELAAQLTTNTNQFNASQQQSASAQNAAATNSMAQQTAALTEAMNQQDLSGAQAKQLAQIQGQYQQLISANSSAAGFYSSMLTSMGSILGNPNITSTRAADSLAAFNSMLQSGLNIIGGINGMDLTGAPTNAVVGPDNSFTVTNPNAPAPAVGHGKG